MGDGGGSNSGEPAVKVHGRADITIVSSELKITDNGQSNSNPAIQVENGGKLTVNNVTATEVYKGIVVKDKGSSVIVNRGTIGVRKNGGAVIEVSGGGDVTLNREVTVNGGGDNTGIEVGQGGGTVTLVGTNFRNVKTGIVFKGNKGTANVVGVAGGATIGVTGSGSVGIKMEGDGRANATVMNMAFMGNRTATGAEVTSGTLTVNTVTMTNVQTGMKVTGSGRANVMGVGATINLASGGIGIKMEGGIANVVNMTFKGSGTGAEGDKWDIDVEYGEDDKCANGGEGDEWDVDGEWGGGLREVGVWGWMCRGMGTVTLSGEVKVEGFETGMKVTKGSVMVTKGSITGQN